MATLRVGVTGLSQAGKTVFLTSTIYHLVERTASSLPKLQDNNVEFSGEINNSKISGEVFPYAEHIASFRSDKPECHL